MKPIEKYIYLLAEKCNTSVVNLHDEQPRILLATQFIIVLSLIHWNLRMSPTLSFLHPVPDMT
jgi:hypothetical protein